MRVGSALVLVLLLVVVVGLLAAALCERAVVGMRVTDTEQKRYRLVSIAESALVRTRFRLSITSDWTTLPSPLYNAQPLFGGTYTVEFTVQEPDAVVARITATYDSRTITLLARIEKPPPWWNTDWSIRCPLTVTNRTSSQLSEYQVRVVVPYQDGMRTDYADLRFIADNQTTVLPYWIEYSDAASAIVWVKVPSIPANASTTIWLYYNNPSATPLSSFTATMEPAYRLYSITYNWLSRPDNNPWLTGLFVSDNLTLPFPFPFYGTFYNNCHITTCGYIRFPAGNYPVDTTPTTTELRNRRMFAAYWGRYSGKHTYNGPGTNDIIYPGVYVYEYPDYVHIEWEVSYVIWSWWLGRWVAVGGVIHQALLYRNGDIIHSMKLRVGISRGLSGISKGDGVTYIENSSVGPSKSFLYAQRKFVSPEPTTKTGSPEPLQLTRLVWLQYE